MFTSKCVGRQRAPRWLRLGQLAIYLLSMGAVSASTLSLDELRQHVREAAPNVLAERARVAAAEQNSARAAALPDPQLMLGIDNLTIDGPQAFALGADMMTMRRIGLRQQWPSRAKRDARQALADAAVEVALGNWQAQRFAAELGAGAAWIAVWAAEAERALLLELQEEAGRAVQLAKARFSSAQAGAAEALAAQSAALEVEIMLSANTAEIESARAELARWHDASSERTLAELPDLDLLRTSISDLRSRLAQQAPLQSWAGLSRAAAADVSLAESGKRPDIGLGLSYGARSAGRPDMLMFEVSIDLPLFKRQRQDREVAAKRAEAEALRADFEHALRAQQAALEGLIAEWRSLGEQVASYESQLLPLVRDRSRLSLSDFAHGGALQAWLDARQAELKAGREAIELRAERARVWLQLDSLLPTDPTAQRNQELAP